ncbi:MAG: patatin-like phospholipase family protein [Proteobacteria bacterium]|nr:patatin-like phospholipase family protein [Pseudomonadota bacterium]
MGPPVSRDPQHGGPTAFVLAGGGSLGAVQAGMLIELASAGLVPDIVVGASAGAINGAFLAFDPSAQMAAHMAELWRRTRTRDILGFSWVAALGVLGLRGHLVGNGRLRAFLERELPCRDFAQTRVPLRVVATDLQSGEEVILDGGSIVEAVLASAAIPGVFPPIRLAGRCLVDGVVASGTPIATAWRLGATRMIVLPSGFSCESDQVPRHPVARAIHAISLLSIRQLREDFVHYGERSVISIVPPPCPLRQSPYDYSQGAALVESARIRTRRWLESGGLESRSFPGALQAHRHAADPADRPPRS